MNGAFVSHMGVMTLVEQKSYLQFLFLKFTELYPEGSKLGLATDRAFCELYVILEQVLPE